MSSLICRRAVAGLMLAALHLAPHPAAAQTGGDPTHQITNAQFTMRPVSGSLAREIDAVAARGDTGWLAYRLPTASGAKQMCSSWSANGAPLILLEPPTEMTLLIRVEAKQVMRVQSATPECAVDAGGLPVLLLTGVSPAESLEWLVTMVKSAPAGTRGPSRLLEPSLAALAWHPGDAAVRALLAFARQDTRPSVRGKALFWLGQRAGQESARGISEAVNEDPEIEVKKKAVSALAQMPPDQGVPLLINLARTHSNREVRRQAMFWLGQSKDPRAISFFEDVLTPRR